MPFHHPPRPIPQKSKLCTTMGYKPIRYDPIWKCPGCGEKVLAASDYVEVGFSVYHRYCWQYPKRKRKVR